MELLTCNKLKVKLIGKCLLATRKIKFIHNIFYKCLIKVASKEVDAQINATLPDWIKMSKAPETAKEAIEKWRVNRELE